MRHRSKHRIFDCQKSKPSPTLTIKYSLHSKSTYFYRWWVPSLCTSALLLGGFIAINPEFSINPNSAYADEVGASADASDLDDNSNIELYTADSSISLTFSPEASFTGNANVDEVSYITNTFTVNVTDHASYTVKMNAMNGSGTELRGRDNAFATIKGVGNNKTPAEFTDNTWGYGYSDNTSANPATLTYSSMPAYGSDESMFTKTLTGTEKNEDYSYLLAFAAKIGADSPADHYVGNFLLSVVGTAFTPETYYLDFHANGGTGAPKEQSCTQTQVGGDCSLTIADGTTTPTKDGYAFIGWADSSTASSAQYTEGSRLTLGSSNTTLTGNKRIKTIYAVWKQNTTYTVTFEANAGTDSVTGMPGNLTHPEPGNSSVTSYQFTIPNITPTRSGYTFQGWATTSTGDVAYKAGATITVQKGSSFTPTQPLFAVWQSNVVPVPFNGITTMQAMTSTICSGADIGTEGILRDTRDDKLYYVTKLKGDTAGTKEKGECWMAQNLAYGTVDDTSIGTPCELSRTDDNPAVTGATCTNGTSWTDSYTDKYFAIGKHDDGSHTSQGNFYNWPAAVQNGTGGTNIQGVCPTGWQLPISNTTTADRSFGKLTTAYSVSSNSAGSTALRSEPLYFQYSGYIDDGPLNRAGTGGGYWSSTMYSSSGAYNLGFNSSVVGPSNNNYRYYGYSVRCVAQ